MTNIFKEFHLLVLIIALFLGASGTAWGYDFSAQCSTGQTLYFDITDATNHYVSIVAPGGTVIYGWTGYTKPVGNIVLPSTVTYNNLSYQVTGIGDYAFNDCNGLSGNLTIPNSVSSIGLDAFKNCSGFTGNLTIPNSVTSIGNDAFYSCCGLTSIIWNAEHITSYPSITNLPFVGCSSLTTVFFGDQVQMIPDLAFSDCIGLTGNLTIPNSVTSIGELAFENCSGLTGNLTIPNSVTSIGAGAFYNCSGLTGDLTIGNSVSSIGGVAFYNCSGLTSVNWNAENVTNYPGASYQPFQGCSNLTTLVFGNQVQMIPDYAFYGCSGLTGNLTIPNSVTSIGNYAFYDCGRFTSTTVHSLTPPILGRMVFHFEVQFSPLIVPCESLSAYQNASGWNEFIDIQCSNYATDENTDSEFTIHPNPADDILFIESDNEFNRCEIFTSTGRLVYRDTNSQNKLTIDVSGLSPGTYIIMLDLNGRLCTRKMVIQ